MLRTATSEEARGLRQAGRLRSLFAIERLLHPGPQVGCRRRACSPCHNLAVAQNHQRGNGLHTESLLQFRCLVHVDLHELDPAGEVGSHLLERRADHPARPAPLRPQIDKHRNLGLLGDLTEGVVASVGNPRQLLVAIPAPGSSGRSCRDAVCPPAIRAFNQLC